MSAKISKSVALKFSDVLDAFEFVSAGGLGEHHACIAVDTGKVQKPVFTQE